MKKSTTPTTEGGNTKTPSSHRRTTFTWNNYTQNDLTEMIDYLTTKLHLYCIGEEIGEKGTPHLQGYIEWKTPRNFSTIKKQFPKIHFEPSKGSRNDNLIYCKKDGKYHSNFPLSPTELTLQTEYPKDIVWYPFQQQILDILDTQPHPRKIYWFHEPIGNTGKSYFCKYLGLTRNIILADGKKHDVFNQVKTTLDNGTIPHIIILDIPRNSLNFINYGVIEQLKNGMIFSGKYEGGLCIFPIPHVIIFSNEPPDQSQLSQDRWSIHFINH